MDTLLFGEGITSLDVRASRTGDNLVLSVGEGDDKVTINSYFNETNGVSVRLVENIQFTDGTAWGIDDIREMTFVPTDGNDTISGFAGFDDDLQGLAGNDTLRGNAGDDILTGGLGNDTLDGGTGNDTYIFNLGNGVDTITDANGTDTLRFGEGIAPLDVRASRSGDNLILTIGNGSDKIIIISYFNETNGVSNNVVENIQFADATVWGINDIREMTFVPTDGNDTIAGFAGYNDDLQGLAGNDTLRGNAGNDIDSVWNDWLVDDEQWRLAA